MFPLRDHNPSLTTPYVNYALIALNIVIFLSYVPLFSDPVALDGFLRNWGMIPARLASGHGFFGLLSSMFLHGGWMHLFGNMLFLYIFGDNLEDQLGHVGYLGFYLAAGIGAGLLQVLADPASSVPMVGASGAIAGVMGGYVLMFPKARVDILLFFVIIFRIFPVPAWAMLGLWFGFQVFNGFTRLSEVGGVAYWAHVGGFLLGLLMMTPLWLKRGGPVFWSRTQGHPANPPAKYGRRGSATPRSEGSAWVSTRITSKSRVPKVGRKR